MRDLRAYRKAHDMTQAELAAKLHVSQEMVAQLEAGTLEPSAKLAARLKEVMADGAARGSSSRGPYFGAPR
jgi:DNA-binding XRE family transcriptional regulator